MKTPLRILLSLAIATILIVLLMAWGDVSVDSLANVWAELPFSIYAIALLIHTWIYFVRAWRFRLLLPAGSRPSFSRVLAASASHNLAAYVLPAKTGEASLIVYLKKTSSVPAAEGAASLILSRILDLAVLAGGVGAACLTVSSLGEETTLPFWIRPLGGVLLALAVLFLALAARGDRLVSLGTWCLRATRLDRTRLGERAAGVAQRTSDALLAAGARGRWLVGALVSIPLWFLVFLFYAVLARGFGLPDTTSLAEAAFGSGLAVVANLLPINGFAGFGTQETGWVVGFAALGIPRDLALSTGIGAHLVQLVNVCLMGVLGHVAMGLLTPSHSQRRDESGAHTGER